MTKFKEKTNSLVSKSGTALPALPIPDRQDPGGGSNGNLKSDDIALNHGSLIPQQDTTTCSERVAKRRKTEDAKDEANSILGLRRVHPRGHELRSENVTDVERCVNPPKPMLYRIENIPQDASEASLVESFKPDEQPRLSVTSLCESVEADTNKLTATVIYRRGDYEDVPHLLNDRMTIDREFFGFTPLYTPKGRIEADIIALTGLGGHAFGSWAISPTEMWLRDFLPDDIPQARILIYGYDSRIQKRSGRGILSDHTNNFIVKLTDMRREGRCELRPVIFIGHSLGCLIIKEALSKSASSPGMNLQQLPVRSLVFFGAPHRGLNILAIKTLVEGWPSEDIVQELKKQSPTLTKLNEDFRDLLGGLDILTIYELEDTPSITQAPDGKWQQDGPPVTMVEKDSAILYWPNERTVGCNADHRYIARVTRGQNGCYSQLRGFMQRSLKEAVTSQPAQPTRYRNLDDISCHQSFKTSRYEEFKDRNPERVRGTCKWVLNHEMYQSWCSSPKDDLLWISADPGCGKSVLSKFLIDEELRTEASRSTCYFFFKDNEEQNDLAIALCAVLHQLFTHKPELLRHAIPIWQRNKDKLQQETGELWRILLSAASDPAAGHVVCILDALDECERQGRETLIGYLKKFHNSSTPEQDFGLNFLVTSRPYVDIKDQWHGITSGIPTLWLAGEMMNEDISKEINHVIDARVLEVSYKKKLSQDLQESLKTKLKGMNNRTYLWLYLVMEQIQDSLKHTQKTYDRIIDTIPSSVQEAYEKILSKSANKSETRSLLYIMVGAARPLTLQEMDVAFSLATQSGCNSYAELDRDGVNLETRIRNLCGLFVYINDSRVQLIHQTAKEFLMQKKSSLPPSLGIWSQSLHKEEPVKELLFEREIYLNTSPQAWSSSIQEEKAEEMMAKICLQYLLFTDFNGPVRNEKPEFNESPEFEFMDYAAVNWTAHFRNAKISEGSLLLSSALTLYESPSWRLRIWFSRYWKNLHTYRDPPQGLTNLHFAAITGHRAMVPKLLMARHAVDVDTKDENGWTALDWAAENGHEAVVRLLLEAGAGVDVHGTDGRTPLHWAAENGHEAVVRLLLEAGAGVDVQDTIGRPPLHEAAVR
jgi:hypothetical protein